MAKICTNCNVSFEIPAEDLKIYEHFVMPQPTFCPLCRMQRRMSFRNERNLYKRKCDFSGKEMLSLYPPDAKYKIYDQKVWWSDSWALSGTRCCSDAMSYGRDFDFTKPFFEQFENLMSEVPRINLQNRNNENSDYCNDTNDMKNSYLCFNSEFASNFYYCTTAGYGSDCVDLFWSLQVELCYECSKCMGAYHCFWCFNCSGVSDCYFCRDLIGCKNCFGCIGLRQKEYCLFNKQLSREEFEKFMRNFAFTYENVEKAKADFAKLCLTVPRRALEMSSCENSKGDYLMNCKNCVDCFDFVQSENCRYFWDGMANNSYDCFNSGLDSAFLYECVGVYRSNNLKFSDKTSASNDMQYCDYCFTCHDCFGCVGLRHKQYCVLNKQYSKEEYGKLVTKIVEYMKKTGEYGEFFPIKLSPFGYNDTLANWYFPLSREEALKKGYKWNDYVSPQPEMSSFVAKDLPQKIEQVGDSMCTEIIECEKDGKLFKIIPQELEFYRKHKLPLPHFCPDCRHEKRKRQMNPRKLWERKCGKCQKDIETTYSPDAPEIVYCEDCYLKEIY